MLCAPAFPRSAARCRKRGAHCFWCAGYCRQTAGVLSSILLYWYHYSHNGERIQRKLMTTLSAVTSCICCTAKSVAKLGKGDAYFAGAVRRTRVNASTFTSRVIAGTGSDMYSALLARLAHCAGRNTAGRMKCAGDPATLRNAGRSRSRYPQAVENKEVVIGFGHPVYTIADRATR